MNDYLRLDFEGIVTWISSIASQIMDAVSGLFLNALGTDMVTMEEYFPFITKAFDVMQYTAWAVLFSLWSGSCSVRSEDPLPKPKTHGN